VIEIGWKPNGSCPSGRKMGAVLLGAGGMNSPSCVGAEAVETRGGGCSASPGPRRCSWIDGVEAEEASDVNGDYNAMYWSARRQE
jgi:hypothetical protein